MADDIVIELHKYGCRCERSDDGYRCLGCKAADEIERLRAGVAELWEFIDTSPDGADLWNAWMGRTWEEARRD